ncbi:DUF397 domain-containing protein [Actinomadura graeca]|uniref:DUF397 domain-containing protein n=1 Tax=Actinomadura graeca TaxID=2750812 RepID=A0ABX8QXL2_9ACTN|nr:DUF397 domain-containing protein [Actinomadura graeca]
MGGQGDWATASWRKSKRSGSDDPPGGGCVSLAASASCGAIRDTRNPCGTMIIIRKAALRRMLDEIKNGVFDLP